jgi:class 3 adenylate cyclase
MAELPTGTVTLLHSDIEGSTQLLRSLGNKYEQALLDHRALLRRAFNLEGGHVIDRQGDAFFVVFRRARDAVTAAIEAQRGLASHPWPDNTELRVRIGIHTGEPSINEDGVTGIAVHWAARICDIAHGGQVLISSTTRDLIQDELPAGVVLRDLGEHALKDFDRPARLFQLLAEGLGDDSPATRTSAGRADTKRLTDDKQAAPSEPTSRTQRPRLRTVAPLRLNSLGAAIRRRRRREPINVIGSRIQYTSRLSPSSELEVGLRALGGAVVQGGRHLREAQRCLRSVDQRQLQRRLDVLTDGRFLTEEEAQLADDLARQVHAIGCLRRLRPVLEDAIDQIDRRVNEIRQEILRARLGHPLSDGVVDEVKARCESLLSLCTQLEEVEQEVRDAPSVSRSRLRLRAPRNP